MTKPPAAVEVPFRVNRDCFLFDKLIGLPAGTTALNQPFFNTFNTSLSVLGPRRPLGPYPTRDRSPSTGWSCSGCSTGKCWRVRGVTRYLVRWRGHTSADRNDLTSGSAKRSLFAAATRCRCTMQRPPLAIAGRRDPRHFPRAAVATHRSAATAARRRPGPPALRHLLPPTVGHRDGGRSGRPPTADSRRGGNGSRLTKGAVTGQAMAGFVRQWSGEARAGGEPGAP